MSRTRMIEVAIQDDVDTQALMEIAVRHVKLALEHSKANTSLDRRKAIQSEIQALRATREAILGRQAGKGGDLLAK